MNRLFKIAGVTACLVAVLTMAGGHWLALQSVAWARMIANYARQDSLVVAVQKTFDGEHPCPMCLKIRTGRQQEERDQQQMPWVKTEKATELFYETRPAVVPLPPSDAHDLPAPVPAFYCGFIDSPLTPPPRFLSSAA